MKRNQCQHASLARSQQFSEFCQVLFFKIDTLKSPCMFNELNRNKHSDCKGLRFSACALGAIKWRIDLHVKYFTYFCFWLHKNAKSRKYLNETSQG